MQYMRCKCGKAEYFHSGIPPKDCQGCSACNTTFGYGPKDHQPRAEHEWEPRYDVRTGEQNKRICKKCYKIEKVT